MKSTERHALRLAMLVGAGALALGSMGCAARVYAPGLSDVVVYSAPPPPRAVVRTPAPYANAVWVDGHWEWNGGQYVWVDGYYVDHRPGYTFVQPRWERRGGQHVYVGGGWAQGGRVVHVVTPGAAVHHRPGVYQQPGVVARPGGVVVHQPGVYQQPGVVARPGGVVVHQGGGVVARPPGVVVHAPPRAVVTPARPAPGRVRVTGPGGATVVVQPR